MGQMQAKADALLYRNEFLFAQAYLEQMLEAKYDEGDLASLAQTFREWRRERGAGDAAELLRTYVGPVLDSLRFARQDEASLPGAARLLPHFGAESPVGALLVIDPASELGCTQKGRHWAEKLVRTMRQWGAGWGILTDGEIWRLYRRDELAPYDTFLEVSLGAAIDARDTNALRIFERFFTAGAFVVGEDEQPALETYRQASIKATQDIEKHLRSSMDDILRNICMGFVRSEGRSVFTESDRDAIFSNSVYLLYRMVFILYAESRGLLPVANPAYAESFSLASIAREAVEHHFRRIERPKETDLWVRLRKLFVWIDEGHRRAPDEGFEITEYDGELFDSAQRPYLSEHLIPNEFLAEAIYQLNCIDDPKRPGSHRWIDYRDLSVRHLGSLYESLLEYKLFIAGQRMVARTSGDKVQYVPVAGTDLKSSEWASVIEQGSVYFGQSPTERKRSGSYYTPEDVVDYIVSNTVCKGLDDLWEEFRPELDRLMADVGASISAQERARLERYTDVRVEQFVRERVLAYRILDPAMGSGHFLVNALQRVTNFVVEKLNETPWANPAVETGPGAWRRRAVERCIFGVDINPLATELAKLSLWLSSASEGKPLSFLNHHLKTGNSLIGARLKDLAALPGAKQDGAQKALPFYVNEILEHALAEYQGIAAQDSDAMDAVEDKKRREKSIGAILTRVRDVANVWVSTFYGNEVSADAYARLLELAGQNHAPESWEAIAAETPSIAAARKITGERRFFHWDLEFAEAVSDGAARFDAVVANPPYVASAADAFVTARYETASCGDLYARFVEVGVELGCAPQRIGMIVPLSLTFGRSLRTLRALLLTSTLELDIACFDNAPDSVFGDGQTPNSQRTAVFVGQHGTHQPVVRTTSLLRWQREERPLLFGNLQFADVTRHATSVLIPKLGSDALDQFYSLLKAQQRTVRDLCVGMHSETQKDNNAQYFLTVPRAARYFIAAFPERLARNKVLTLTFSCADDRDLAMVLLNSNVHFWYYGVVGDGFLTNLEVVSSFAAPANPSTEYRFLARRLLEAMPSCTTFARNRGMLVPSYNFNKRMDILLEIDDWVVRHLAPDLNLPRDTFAQYKSNSFLRPLVYLRPASCAEGPSNE